MKRMSSKIRSLADRPTRPLLLVLSGPSGVGKDAVLSRMKERQYPLEYITTVTTRHRRAGERDGGDYHFISGQKFRAMVKADELLEWAEVYGNGYGVPRAPVKQALDSGRDTVVKVDIQGAATLKKILPQAVFIFLMPPSMDELMLRLKNRDTELDADLALRTRTAEGELEQASFFDYVVYSRRDEIDRAVSDIGAIITAEKCRINRPEISL